MTGTIVEIRRYIANPGKRAELAAYMDRVVIPFVRARGMEVTASLLDRNDPDAYIWIRSFRDEPHRERTYDAVYQDPEWIETVKPVVADLMALDRAVITTATPTLEAG
ncbi:NIPSNAP family protein [Agromyces larvae]|uniref:NIPSNAP family protein n=1 Tax=Agromyces larvae TaxID=2929802 RepID=A0ABY4BY44_9MICO|nr:NIPSNAP family protein [Agromyces larvae]UOE44142.1 NIPSNAP family protein [Agromyces larvae]